MRHANQAGLSFTTMSDAVATRTDPITGTVDAVQFLGRADDRMFATTVSPPAESRAGVVVCPSIMADFIPNYRREVVLSRELATTGIAAQRFHYRGIGHSDGKAVDLSFKSMVGDAMEAAAHLIDNSDFSRLGFVGTRFGALTAAAVAAQHPGSPLALWEPTLSPKSYFREAFRAVMMMGVHLDEADRITTADMQRELAEEGATQILGYPVHKAFYDDVVERDLVGELGTDPRPILVVQLGGNGLRKDNQGAVDRWKDAGFEVTTHVLPTKEAWWFLDDRAVPSADLVRLTVDWFGAQFR